MTTRTVLSYRIRAYRETRHFSQSELARTVRITPAFLSHLETGIRWPSVPVLLRLCAALDCTPNDLLGMS